MGNLISILMHALDISVGDHNLPCCIYIYINKIYFKYFDILLIHLLLAFVSQFGFWGMGASLCSSRCPQTHDFSALVAQVLGLKVLTTKCAALH